MPMDRETLKTILVQYADMQQEIKDLQKRIDKKQKMINQMEQQGYVVKDTVRGSRPDGTIGPIVIEGFPYPEYTWNKSQLQQSMMRMREKAEELLEITNKAEEYIEKIPSPKARRIFRLRYLDSLSWVQVAHMMGRGYTADSCRMLHDRILEKF